MKNAVIYARYSSDKQTEQSIEGQLHDCYDYAKDNNINIIHEYIDRAMTGKNDDRPAFQQMLSDSKKRGFEIVLVWKLDRFARNTTDAAVNRLTLRKNNVRLVSVKEQFGDNYNGDMMVHVIEAVNEWYSADLREKTIRGMRESANKCQSTGHIPYGYKVVDKKLVINEEERIVPETVFRMYYEGERLTDIAETLNNMGLRTRKGNKFTVNSFYDMLKNEAYIGVYKYGDVRIEGGIPRIMDDEVFYGVREIMARNRKRAAKNAARADYFLSGKLYCGYCGEPMSGLSGHSQSGGKYYYYRCNGVQKKTGCKKKNEVKDQIETEIILQALDLFKSVDKKVIAEQVHDMYAAAMTDPAKIAMYESKIAEAEKEASNLVNAIAKTGGNQLIFDKLNDITEQKNAMESELRVMKNAGSQIPSVEQLIILIDDIINSDISAMEGKKAVANFLISKVYVYDDHFKVILKGDDTSDPDKIKLDDLSDSLYSIGSGEPEPTHTNFFVIKNCVCIRINRRGN